MSRIGKKIIKIPEKVTVTLAGGQLSVKGPLGELSRPWPEALTLTLADNQATIAPVKLNPAIRALWGTYGSHLVNMIAGVTRGFEKKMIIEGVGYRAAVTGPNLTLNLGFSHPVVMPIPAGIKVAVEKGNMSVGGFDKEAVGQFAAVVRAHRPPEPYKGKGIRYADEIIRRKEGKKVVA